MPPELGFVQNFKSQFQHEESPFTYLERSNIVHHTTCRPTKLLYFKRAALFRGCAPVGLPTKPCLSMANLEPTKGRRSHYRIRTVADGKFLIFGTGNIILAGRKSHADACLSATRMIRTLSATHRVFPVIHSSPNAVITGRLKFKVAESIKHSLFANFSNKFPGIALTIATPRVTPELYIKRGMVIIPGITTSASLCQAVREIKEIIAPHQTLEPY
jgi:TATA-box binding protein (TBP) (component of TFIID and TFIIIB)